MIHLRPVSVWLCALFLYGIIASGAVAQSAPEPTIPNFWDPQERLPKPTLPTLPRLRFLTVTDFPPFSYVDDDKRLSGFHVDLARAICEELNLLSVCQIQAVPFAEIEQALRSGGGEAAMAGHVVSAQTRARLTFSRPYFRIPARFLAPIGTNYSAPMVESLKGKTVAVVAGTAHLAYARQYFDDLILRQFDTEAAAIEALQQKKVEAVFSDSLSMAFWMRRQGAKACCVFTGPAFLDNGFFGRALSVALPRNQVELRQSIDYALRSINDKGKFAELYLRYFPVSLF